jgi:hypothetical protein
MQRLVADLQGESVGVEVYRNGAIAVPLSALGFDVVKPQARSMFPGLR